MMGILEGAHVCPNGGRTLHVHMAQEFPFEAPAVHVIYDLK